MEHYHEKVRDIANNSVNYISSVCAVPNSTLVAVSSSRGGVTLIWDSRQGKVLQVIAALDGSGIAAASGTLYLASGDGSLHQIAQQERNWVSTALVHHPDIQWDNHMAILRP